MSTFYKENNNETSLELFNKKLIYNSDVLKTDYPNLIDFNFAEKALYGKVDRNYIPIAASSNTFKNFISSGNPRQNIQAIGFVVDAFEALAQQFKKAEQSGKIYSNDPNLTNLKVYKSYKDNNISYEEYQVNFIKALKTNLNVSNIQNFQTFIKELLSTVTNITRTFPMSMPAYTKSRLNNLTNSGLALEIADLPYDNDDQKINDFVNSKNWEFYVNACNSYGFMIDIGAPWRLIADIDSEAMKGYASSYGLRSSSAILALGFSTTHNRFYNQMTQRLLRLYNEVVPTHIPTFDECGPKIVTTERYTLQSLQEKFSNDFFLKFYFALRFSEEESQFSNAEKQRIIKDCLQLSRSSDNRRALGVFERYVNQPFDYRGSLSYLVKAQRLREDT
jgi:hypothetical protein|tara:strand:+ start:719 stop:1891 length:1173 start_codon:yes stop_codon:yes gene_type:complete